MTCDQRGVSQVIQARHALHIVSEARSIQHLARFQGHGTGLIGEIFGG